MWRGRQQLCRFVHSVASLITFLPHHVFWTRAYIMRDFLITNLMLICLLRCYLFVRISSRLILRHRNSLLSGWNSCFVFSRSMFHIPVFVAEDYRDLPYSCQWVHTRCHTHVAGSNLDLAAKWTIWGLIFGGWKEFILSLERLNKLFDPPSFLLNWYRGFT